MKPCSPTHVHSGGQTGADIGGIHGARRVGVATGGYAPKGFMTEVGNKPDILGGVYGLCEHTSGGYQERTRLNVMNADATLIFSPNSRSSGTVATVHYCEDLCKPWRLLDSVSDFEHCLQQVIEFIEEHRPATLNVAGNRESVAPGIGNATARLISSTMLQLPVHIVHMNRFIVDDVDQRSIGDQGASPLPMYELSRLDLDSNLPLIIHSQGFSRINAGLCLLEAFSGLDEGCLFGSSMEILDWNRLAEGVRKLNEREVWIYNPRYEGIARKSVFYPQSAQYATLTFCGIRSDRNEPESVHMFPQNA